MNSFIKTYSFTLLLLFATNLSAQSIIEEIDSSDSSSIGNPKLVTEKIEKISVSKRIFIITNTNASFAKGDFISLLLGEKLAARALVAKVTEQKMAGIKILKIYSLPHWNSLRRGKSVQIIRGDDSYYRTAKDENNKAEDEFKIKDDDDLYNDTMLSEDINLEQNSKRIIKQDNMLALNLSSIEGLNSSGNTKRYAQINGFWAYQIEDNIWGEVSYGRSIINDFPESGLDTTFSNITVRAKYTIKAPFFSYLMPYLGYQVKMADSPGAGVPDDESGKSTEELNAEIELVEKLAKKSIVFGVTILRRLVPGWFVRGDLGSDVMGIGATIEF